MREQLQENPNLVRAAILTAAMTAGSVLLPACGSESRHDGTTTTTATTEQPSAENGCQDTREIKQTNNDGHRIVADGIPSIGTVTTPEQAREAAWDVLTVVGSDPEILAGYSHAFLDKEVDPAALYSKDRKCLSTKGEKLFGELIGTFAKSSITPDQAPTNGVNSGVEAGGTVVVAAHAGISGDRKAILIETEDGKKVWVMKRCGNFVTTGENVPNMPKGPTDQPETPETKVPAKHDDGKLPGDGTPASQDPGTPDVQGPESNGVPGAGRPGDAKVDDTGHAPGEKKPAQPQAPATTTTTKPASSDNHPVPTTVVAPPSTVPQETTTMPPTDEPPRP